MVEPVPLELDEPVEPDPSPSPSSRCPSSSRVPELVEPVDDSPLLVEVPVEVLPVLPVDAAPSWAGAEEVPPVLVDDVVDGVEPVPGDAGAVRRRRRGARAVARRRGRRVRAAHIARRGPAAARCRGGRVERRLSTAFTDRCAGLVAAPAGGFGDAVASSGRRRRQRLRCAGGVSDNCLDRRAAGNRSCAGRSPE